MHSLSDPGHFAYEPVDYLVVLIHEQLKFEAKYLMCNPT